MPSGGIGRIGPRPCLYGWLIMKTPIRIMAISVSVILGIAMVVLELLLQPDVGRGSVLHNIVDHCLGILQRRSNCGGNSSASSGCMGCLANLIARRDEFKGSFDIGNLSEQVKVEIADSCRNHWIPEA